MVIKDFLACSIVGTSSACSVLEESKLWASIGPALQIFFDIGTLPVGFSRVLIFFAKMTNEFVEIMEVQGIDKSQGYERYC